MAKGSAKATDRAGFEKALRKAAAAREAVIGARAAQAVLDAENDKLESQVVADRAALRRAEQQVAERGKRLKKAGKRRESLTARGKQARRAAQAAEQKAAKAQKKLAGLEPPAERPAKRARKAAPGKTPTVTGSVAPPKKRRTPTT